MASSSSLQVTFWEPLSVNSAIVTKYKGKDQDPRSRARSHSHSRCLAPRGNTTAPWAVLPSPSQATFMLEHRSSQGCWTAWPPPKCSELDQTSSCTNANLGVSFVGCPLILHTGRTLLSCTPHPLKPDIFIFWKNFFHPPLLRHQLKVLTPSDMAW